MLLYWMLRERPPTPYCELKPASFEQQQMPLADQREWTQVLTQLSQLSFPQLVNRLSHTQLIENGYAEQDLALACLIAFHHFDIQRALPKNAQPQQKRVLAWKPKGQHSSITLVVYPDLTQQQFQSLIQFAKSERWPLTAEGLFLLLQSQKETNNLNDDLVETFVLTPEFWTAELLFNRAGQRANKQEILTVLLEGNWNILKQFVEQQRQVHDSSDARRQKFLLDYLKAGSQSAAILLLKMEWDFSVKKIDDQQVIAILRLMPNNLPESMRFAKEMLMSPRSTNVWRQASQWLYNQAGESTPKEWNYQTALARFVPEKPMVELVSKELVAKTAVSSSALTAPLPLARSKIALAAPIKPGISEKPKIMANPPVLKAVKASSLSIKTAAETKKATVVSTAVAKPRTYVVQEKDSLWKIARLFGVKVDDLKTINNLKSEILKSGMTLKIPEANGKEQKKKN
jgi:LysM repeat protein